MLSQVTYGGLIRTNPAPTAMIGLDGSGWEGYQATPLIHPAILFCPAIARVNLAKGIPTPLTLGSGNSLNKTFRGGGLGSGATGATVGMTLAHHPLADAGTGAWSVWWQGNIGTTANNHTLWSKRTDGSIGEGARLQYNAANAVRASMFNTVGTQFNTGTFTTTPNTNVNFFVTYSGGVAGTLTFYNGFSVVSSVAITGTPRNPLGGFSINCQNDVGNNTAAAFVNTFAYWNGYALTQRDTLVITRNPRLIIRPRINVQYWGETVLANGRGRMFMGS